MDPEITKLGKYDVISLLGRGSMGIVYKCHDPFIERVVAIKTIRNDMGSENTQIGLARFKREAIAAGRLHHPNIVGIHDYWEEHNTACIVMEFIEGYSLKDSLDMRKHWDIPAILKIMRQILSALGYSHQHGVIHRDIKPANIMLMKGDVVKVADFGIARIESSTMTQVGTVMGTPAYMSPEQFMGNTVDKRTDLYSTGIILYQMLTGKKPFNGGYATIMYQALNNMPDAPSVLNVHIPKAFDHVVLKAISKKPEDRFQNADEFLLALEEAAVNKVTVQIPPPLRPPSGRPATEKSTGYIREAPELVGGAEQLPNKSLGAILLPVFRTRMFRAAGMISFVMLILAILITWKAQNSPTAEVSNPLINVAAQNSPTAEVSNPLINVAAQDSATAEVSNPLINVPARDCSDCPEMIVVPAGSFKMGSPQDEVARNWDEGPEHVVKVKVFQLGKYEVTFAEWDACVAAGGCDQNPSDQGWGRGQRPVINVSWDDAQQYVQWLSHKTGKKYRLPSEAEWEYAARAGTIGPFSFKGLITPEKANYNGNYQYDGSSEGEYRQKTLPVGSFPPNAWGFFDMHGNVLEWVEDCLHDSYKNAPSDGTAWEMDGDCSKRMARGGSWSGYPWYLRVAFRDRYIIDSRLNDLGFRVAKTLIP